MVRRAFSSDGALVMAPAHRPAAPVTCQARLKERDGAARCTWRRSSGSVVAADSWLAAGTWRPSRGRAAECRARGSDLVSDGRSLRSAPDQAAARAEPRGRPITFEAIIIGSAAWCPRYPDPNRIRLTSGSAVSTLGRDRAIPLAQLTPVALHQPRTKPAPGQAAPLLLGCGPRRARRPGQRRRPTRRPRPPRSGRGLATASRIDAPRRLTRPTADSSAPGCEHPQPPLSARR